MTSKSMQDKQTAQEQLSTIVSTSIDKAIENAHKLSDVLVDSTKHEVDIACARMLLLKVEQLMANLPQDFKQTREILLNGFRYRTTPKEVPHVESVPGSDAERVD